MGKKRIYVALCLIALAMLGICFFYLKKTGWGMTGDKAWNELLDLDKNITLEQLEAKGYINVTGCLDEENETAFYEKFPILMQETGVRLFLDLQAMRMMICVLRYCYMIRIIILFRCGRCILTDSRL